MIAIVKRRSGCEVGVRGLARANAGRNWKDGMAVRGSAEEVWRRVTGMTVEQEAAMDSRERKCAARRLVKWTEGFLSRRVSDGEMGAKRTNYEGRSTRDESEEESAVLGTGLRTASDPWHQGEVQHGPTLGALRTDLNGEISGTQEEGCRAETWACAGGFGGDVERVCARLGMSEARFTRLTKAFLNVSARELTEGIRLRGVRETLRSHVCEAANVLWGEPGARTYLRVMDEELKVTRPGGHWFVWSPERFAREELSVERKRRVEELFARVERGWRSGGFDRDAFALSLGFASFAKFRRACVNVDGETPRQKIWRLCCEVVEYYLAAEAKVLRDLAMAERETTETIRARWLYSGETARCAASTDYWGAMEYGQRELLEEMMGVLGPPVG